ncbi:hypothetical protein CYMTET_36151, partial [Cymbomonas tetramitiformis]
MRSPANASRRRHFVVGGGEGGEVYQVKNLGNPMMDGLEGKGLLDSVLHAYPRHTPILLLPGTRAPEAYANWDDLLESAKCIAEAPPLEAGGGWMFLAPTPHALPVAPFQQSLRAAGWKMPPSAAPKVGSFSHGVDPLLVMQQAGFADAAQNCSAAVAMAGTATEQ